MNNVLIWFRADLRTGDNRALTAACDAARSAGGRVVAIFIITPAQWRAHDWAPVKVDFILRTLAALSGALHKLGIPLIIRECGTFAQTPELIAQSAREHTCAGVHWNAEYEVNEARRDSEVASLLDREGIDSEAHDDQTVIPPSALRTGEGRFYAVFTPFKKAWLNRVDELGGIEAIGVAAPPRKQPQPKGTEPPPIPESIHGFTSTVPPELWPAGEDAAEKRLTRFVGLSIAHYKDRRDLPALDATSTLSPYLAVGAISARRCVQAAALANKGRLEGGNAGIATWISEVIWREFYRNIIVAFPRVSMGRAFKAATERIRWRDDESGFAAWCEGRTGVPIVDAGMRQLRATGWMHNRVRMLTAMYLTKDLFIDWRRGEQHFMRHLIDGDLAQNNGGWQWSASTGTDAAPYFRIFNPITQSRKFDPRGDYIRKWVPELAALSGCDDGSGPIHDPFGEDGLPPLARSGLNYPEPIVDHRKARDQVMEAFKAIA